MNKSSVPEAAGTAEKEIQNFVNYLFISIPKLAWCLAGPGFKGALKGPGIAIP